jgi:predicted nucleic acid-binding protein
MADRIVINTGPLIALARMDALDVAAGLPFEFICPLEVKDELDDGVAQGHAVIAPSWLTVAPLSAPLSPVSVAGLDRGEAAVIQLALEQGVPRVCIDETKGRRAASAIGLSVIGSLGLMSRAKVLGLIPALRPLVAKAMQGGVFYHPDLVKQVLNAVGE